VTLSTRRRLATRTLESLNQCSVVVRDGSGGRGPLWANTSSYFFCLPGFFPPSVIVTLSVIISFSPFLLFSLDSTYNTTLQPEQEFGRDGPGRQAACLHWANFPPFGLDSLACLLDFTVPSRLGQRFHLNLLVLYKVSLFITIFIERKELRVIGRNDEKGNGDGK